MQLKQITAIKKYFTAKTGNNFAEFACLALVFLVQFVVDNTIRNVYSPGMVIYISVSLLWLLNIVMLGYCANRRVFIVIQLLLALLMVLAKVPHLYYFNMFSFYTRVGYIFKMPFLRVALYAVYVAVFFAVIYIIALWQFKMLKGVARDKIVLSVLAVSLLGNMITVKTYKRKNFILKAEVTNASVVKTIWADYLSFIKGRKAITSYQCAELGNISPSIKYLYNDTGKRQLVMIIESWSLLQNTADNNNLAAYLNTSLPTAYKTFSNSYNLTFNTACFNGNTASAEGRELINLGNEESFQAFLQKNIPVPYNLVQHKNSQGYFTVAGYPSLKEYGSSHGNEEGFRQKLGFKSTFYFDELLKKAQGRLNTENSYMSVNDEVMIDSLFEACAKHYKAFAYGLTINTHQPFNLDVKQVNSIDYAAKKVVLYNLFNGNDAAFNQYYRIIKILEHIFYMLNKNPGIFNSVIIIGDHANPDIRSNYLFNQQQVPYYLLTQKNNTH